MSDSSVPVPVLGPRGYVIPSAQEVLTGVLADMNAAFGGGLNLALDTPQGQLSSSLAAIILDTYAQFQLLTNNVDPAYASGRMQDAIARIYFLERLPALPTTVVATCSGIVGAKIPVGALAKAQDGTLYACTQAGSIGPEGTVDLSFAATVDGPIACPATTLDTVAQTLPGWEAITNADPGIPGRSIETRQAFEYRRIQSVQGNAVGVLPAVLAAVLAVPDVIDAYVTENFTGSPVVLDGVTLPAHSLYVCAAGGAAQAIAEAIWRKKPPGCDMAGDTTETVYDTSPGYAIPYPSYDITFQTAAAQNFLFYIQIADNGFVPADAVTQIQGAIAAAFNGTDGGPPARIGSTVYASRFYGGISALGSWCQIIYLKLSSSSFPPVEFTASIAGTVMTVTAVASGTLATFYTVIATGMPAGVRIVSFGTGSGGTGTYNLNLPQTFSSTTMYATFPDEDNVEVGVAHLPVFEPPNLLLQLV